MAEDLSIDVGDILLGLFRYDNNQQPEPHPVLVLEVLEWGVRVACGTSQQAETAPLPFELALSVEDAKHCGLHKATRFNLKKRDIMPGDLSDKAWVTCLSNGSPKIGVLSPRLYARLRRAAVEAGLM